MLHIFCPHCGELRSEEEFHASGQAHIPRPLDPNSCTELWNHVAGCRQFFNATRNTVTYEILETYRIGSQPQFTEQSPAPAPTTATRELGEKV